MKESVVLISKPGLGTTRPEDSDFGREMMERFLHSLEKQVPRPRAICFYTEGVRVALKGGGFEMALGLLKGLGVRLVSCRTCLDHYGIADEEVLGEISGMDEIVHLMSHASKVIQM